MELIIEFRLHQAIGWLFIDFEIDVLYGKINLRRLLWLVYGCAVILELFSTAERVALSCRPQNRVPEL